MAFPQFWSNQSEKPDKVADEISPTPGYLNKRSKQAALMFFNSKKSPDDAWPLKIQHYHVAVTPYMLTDLNIIKERCKLFKKLLPDVSLYYAVKAFSDKEVILSITDLIDGFDVASIEEINLLLSLGVDPRRILYSNPVKPVESIGEAVLRGIDKFSFQSSEELQKIALAGKEVAVFVRVKMDDSHSAVPLSAKYGCSPKEAVALLKYAAQLNLRPAGITFHVGSQQQGLQDWTKAIHTSQMLMREAKREGLSVSVVNIGGGFPVRYLPNDLEIGQIAQTVEKAIKGGRRFKYLAEPGRFIVAESSVIVSSIIGIERRQGKQWLFLDVGLFQAFSGAQRFESFPYPPYALNKVSELLSKGEPIHYTLTGPSCDSFDIITNDILLPANLKIGDRLVFPNTGAYTVVYGSNFNGFKIPPRFFITSKRPTASRDLI